MSDPRDRQELADYAPHSVEIEQALIGSMMRHPALIDEACAEINGDHLFDPLHARLFDMLVALHADGDKPTPLIVHSVMKSDAGLIEAGGMGYLEALWGVAPAIVTMKAWIRTILDLHLRRQLQGIASSLASGAVAPPSEVTARETAEQAVEALLQAGRVGAKPILSIREIAAESIQEIEDAKHGKPIPMVKTGLAKVDALIGGLRGGDVAIIMGKPGWGKSALKGSISRNTAKAGVPTLVFSLEMQRRQWIERMMCDEDFDTAERPMWYSRIRNGKLSDEEFQRFILASQNTDDWPFQINDEDGLTISQIAAQARAFAAKYGRHEDGSPRIGIIFIDYMQIIRPMDDRAPREQQVNQIARGVKALAKRLNWPVVVGSQMNEDDKQRSAQEKRPQAGDARESKGIVNEADFIFAPWRQAIFIERRKPMGASPGDPEWDAWAADMREARHRMDLLCLKARHGNTFDVELYADMAASAIRDEAPRRRSVPSPEEQAAADLLAGV